MSLLTIILSFLSVYGPLISVLGGIFGGEETLILFSIFAAHNVISIWVVAIFFYIGILISDTIWFFVGKTELFNRIVSGKSASKIYGYWDKLLDKATKGNDFQALLITKFLYGFRLITIMYLSRERLDLKNFILYSIIVDAIWISVITTIGWLTGKGIAAAANISNNLELVLILIGLSLLAFFLIMRFLSILVKRWLIKKQKQ